MPPLGRVAVRCELAVESDVDRTGHVPVEIEGVTVGATEAPAHVEDDGRALCAVALEKRVEAVRVDQMTCHDPRLRRTWTPAPRFLGRELEGERVTRPRGEALGDVAEPAHLGLGREDLRIVDQRPGEDLRV